MGISRLYVTGTPFNATELADLDYEQTADVVYFAHLDHAPQKLTRAGHTDWSFADVTFGPTIAAPAAPTATPTGSVLDPGYVARNYYYVVTAIDDDSGQESRASPSGTCVNDLTLNGHYNTVAWAAVAGAERYSIYKSENGTSPSDFGYIGSTESLTFVDQAIAGDLADTPPQGLNPFDVTGNFPSTITFHDQRSIWARTRNKPNGIWGSQSADFENMDTSRPAKADDALSFGLVGTRVNAVNQLASMKGLLALTSDAVFSISGSGADDPLSPSAIVPRRQTGRGSSRLSPLVIDNVAMFRPSQGSTIRTLGFTFEIDGYQSNNISIFSPHMFNGFDIVAWAYQQEPYSCVWAVRNDGILLCLTWEQEQQVWGWAVCQTDGAVEDVCVITENGMDRLYLAVRRTLNEVENVYIERMALPVLVASQLTGACHLDCATSQIFETPTATVGLLWHLEGVEVTAFHDGYVTTGLTVTNGQITLPGAASTVSVGLPYIGEIETLPLALNSQLHTARQMASHAVVRVENTRGLSAGAGGSEMFEIKQRQSEALGDPITLFSGDLLCPLSAKWNGGATVKVRQTYPLPATVTAVFPDVNPTD